MWKRFLLGGVVIVLATAGTLSSAVLLEVDRAVDIFRVSGASIPGLEEVLDDVEAGAPQTVLLLGSDRRYADRMAGIPGRSDTMILVRLDPDRQVTSLLAIPRDLKVRLPAPGEAGDQDGLVTDRINASYAIGGPRLAVQTVKEVFGIEINHFVNVNFGGFRRAVDRLDCVYADVDRRYFNDNSPPVDSPTPYAAIDIKPGYQKLCGQDSLDYVRYRHGDTDIMRGARQQDWLGEAKDQVGVEKVFRDREDLVAIFGTYVQTNIRSTSAVLRLLKLIYQSSREPLSEVRFRGDLGQTFVTAGDEDVAAMREEFLNGRQTEGAKGRARDERGRRRAQRERGAPAEPADDGLEQAVRPGQDQAAAAAVKLSFPVLFPRARLEGSQYVDAPRTYDLYGPDRRRHRAYRMVLEAEGVGEFYGIQGTSWTDPPILAGPSQVRRMDGRELLLFRDGTRLARVAVRTDEAVYWVSNTLLRSLTNEQMLAIARSLTPIGSRG